MTVMVSSNKVAMVVSSEGLWQIKTQCLSACEAARRVWEAGPAHWHGAGGAAHRQRRGAGRIQLLRARGAA